MPTAVAITDRLLRGLCVKHPIDEPNPVNVLAIYDAIMLRFTIFVMGVHGAVLLAMVGLLSGRQWTAQLVPLMLGFTMISIGNLLPKTRPNLAIGICTRRTLSDRALWIRTHRSAGYIVVACGVVVVLSAIAVPLFDQTGLPVAAVCFFGFQDEQAMQKQVSPLAQLGETISASLGYRQLSHALVG